MPTYLRRDGNAFISATMRDILLQHVDGALVPIIQLTSIADPMERERAGLIHRSMAALVNRGFIQPVRPNGKQTKVFRPTHTVITESGRVALRKVCAEYAEVLVRAGWRVEEIRYAATLGGGLVDELREVAKTRADVIQTESV